MRPRLVCFTSQPLQSPVLHATLLEQLALIQAVDDTEIYGAGQPLGQPWQSSTLPVNGFAGLWRTWVREVAVVLRRRPATVYVRDVVVAVPLLLLPRFILRRLIFDHRGVVAEEAELRGGSRTRVRLLRGLERLLVRRADHIQCVSSAAADYVRSLGARKPIEVVPNGRIYENRIPRGDDGSGPQVAYVGGEGPWQELELSLAFLEALQRRHPKIAVRAAINTSAIEAYRRRHPHLQIDRLSAREADELVGNSTAVLAFRADTFVTRVASPVKLAEALSAGTAVLVTPATWERVDELEQAGCALVLSGASEPSEIDRAAAWVNEISSRGPRARREIHESSKPLLDLKAYAANLHAFFGR